MEEVMVISEFDPRQTSGDNEANAYSEPIRNLHAAVWMGAKPTLNLRKIYHTSGYYCGHSLREMYKLHQSTKNLVMTIGAEVCTAC